MGTQKFGPRSKQERRLRHKRSSQSRGSGDSNAQEIIPEEAADAKAERRRQLQHELQAAQGQMSSKKKKRLDKYIESKLKKEENAELLKKLALQKSDTPGLQSSRNFARKKPVSARQLRLKQALTSHDGSRFQDDAESSEDDDDDDDQPGLARPPQSSLAALGSGLKRPLERDASGAPLIRKRQRVSAFPVFANAKSTFQISKSTNDLTSQESSPSGSYKAASELSWNGFSEDGAESSPKQTSESDNTSTFDSDGDSIDDSDESGESGDSEDDEDVNDLAASMFAALAQAKRASGLSNTGQTRKRDVSGFKEWANEQLNEARDFVPSRALDDIQISTESRQLSGTAHFQPRSPDREDLPPEIQVPDASSDRRSHAVVVKRSDDVQDARMKLPVVAEEQKIMEAIHNNPVTVICGATGSGKTTQIPQFLFEAGYGDPAGPTPGMIAVTQPRRVAAVTMAQRVSQELGEFGHKVAYQIRYGSTVKRDTAIKFMTDGILIREIATDFKLTKYSAIVIDEAHERSVNTDILIGMLSRIAELRADDHQEDPKKNQPLKLVVMSATLMAEAFLSNPKLFRKGTPPLVQSEGRQYPVTMHFSRRTQRDYLDESFKKILRGHKKLRPGAMLVFLTGENEIVHLSRRLHEALGKRNYRPNRKVTIATSEAPMEADDFEALQPSQAYASSDNGEYSEGSDEDTMSEVTEDLAQPDDDEDERSDAVILPLHSKLPTKEQLRVFEPPPKNTRLIVLATNVAETSVTIPGVRYVFDCGRSKEKIYNQRTGVQSFEIGWISKASAIQRAGRAGRTGPGHCYRLYSSAIYERDFEENTQPEILRMPAEGVVLQLKSMDLQHVANFPFPTPPDQQQIVKAEKLLSYLGALDGTGKVTAIGRELSIYPVSPRYAKMLAIGHQQDCMLLTIAMVAALATPELFVPPDRQEASAFRVSNGLYDSQDIEDEARKEREKRFSSTQSLFGALDEFSDAIKLTCAFGAYATAISQDEVEAFCESYCVRPKASKEAYQLFQQLTRIVAENHPGLVDPGAKEVPTPKKYQIAALKKIVAVGFIDQVAIRADLLPSPPSLPKPRRATDVAYVTLFPSHDDAIRTSGEATGPEQRVVYIHQSSVLAQRKAAEMPQYLVYSHLQRGSTKVRMFPLTSVSEKDLAGLAKGTPLIEYSKPLGKVEVVPGEPNKRICWVVPSLAGRRGTTGWPLREQKVLQKRIKGVWTTEKFADNY